MRALLDGVFEAEEGFEEIENDQEFEDKGGGSIYFFFLYAPLTART